MKEGIHPNYRKVVFKDVGVDFEVLVGSTIETDQTIKYKDGKEYPLVKVDISSASHPFYTGNQRTMDTEGRIEKFKKKYAKK